MKKSVDTPTYDNYSQETNHNFFTLTNHFYRIKNDLILCFQIMFLFNEKLPIIYANIRV